MFLDPRQKYKFCYATAFIKQALELTAMELLSDYSNLIKHYHFDTQTQVIINVFQILMSLF